MPDMSQFKKIILQNRKSVLLFITVGCFSAVFYISLFTLLLKMLHFHYQIAISIAYVVSATLYFLVNRKVTFKNSINATSQQLPRYLILLMINYLVTLTVMHTTVEILSLPPYIGIVAAIGTTFMLSYTIFRFWVFKNAY